MTKKKKKKRKGKDIWKSTCKARLPVKYKMFHLLYFKGREEGRQREGGGRVEGI